MQAKGPSNTQNSLLDGALRDRDKSNRPKLTHCTDGGRFRVGYFSSLLGDEITRGQPLMFLHAQTSGEMAYALAYVQGIGDIVKIEP